MKNEPRREKMRHALTHTHTQFDENKLDDLTLNKNDFLDDSKTILPRIAQMSC